MYDFILFGATGFTGRLTAHYLAQHGGSSRWAIAGRNSHKLDLLCKELQQAYPDTAPADYLTANLRDLDQLRSTIKTARVVITTIGPYLEHGEPILQACAETGTDYLDLTGEPEFVNTMYPRYHAVARENHARIINCCGFDSIPHDLGVFYTIKYLQEQLQQPLADVECRGYVTARGRFSGGTFHSAINAMSRFFANYGKQNVVLDTHRMIEQLPLVPFHHKELKHWACPLPTIDPQVVCRSAAQLKHYGESFQYGHYALVKRLPKLVAGALAFGGIFALSQFQPTRNWLKKRFPEQGDGPTPERRARSWFKVVFTASSQGTSVTTQVKGGDPGYDETAKMIAECALCLVQDHEQLPPIYGFVTPAAAMGNHLITRLHKAGMQFERLTTQEQKNTAE